MKNLSGPDLIYNQAFVNAYTELAINQTAISAKKSVTWQQITDIFAKLKVPLHPTPVDNVSQMQ